jgi:hypothetical protein
MTMSDNCRIVPILMQRDGISQAEAEELVDDAKQRVLAGEDPEEILLEDFGLEPDFLFDLITY